MKIAVGLSITAILLMSLFTTLPLSFSQQQGYNWAHPAYDVTNSGSSPQTAINKNNVNSLELRWIFQIPGSLYSYGGIKELQGYENPHTPTGIQTVPLVVNGIVYVASDYNGLFAIRAENKQFLWKFTPPVALFENKPWWSHILAQHGIDYYDDTIWMQSSDCSIYGLDPLTGEKKVEIPDTCKDIPGNSGVYFGSFAPIIYKNMIITRPSGGVGERGFVAAYDMTGKLLWRWYAVPPTGGDPDWDEKSGASKGNINAYKGDWGQNDLMGGASVWSLMALDEQSGTIYFPTEIPSPDYNAAQRPGPNLYTDSIVALDAMTGEMKWYYQMNPHDIYHHSARWSVILADITIQGAQKKVVIAGAKNNYVYVLDAASGKPIYDSIHVGPPSKDVLNTNAGNNANMLLSQDAEVGKQICPGFTGGIDAGPAFADQTIYVLTQNFCTTYVKDKKDYKGVAIDGFEHVAVNTGAGNASIYAIDASNGRTKWRFDLFNRQQYSSVTTSGGMVFVVDRVGIVYALDQQTGKLLRTWDFGGLGGAGVSVGATARGEMMLFVASGGSGELQTRTSGVLAAFALPKGTVAPVQVQQGQQGGLDTLTLAAFGVAVVAVIYAVAITLRFRKK